MIWGDIGILAAALTSFGFVPQIVRIWKYNSAKDVSLLTLLQFALGLSLWITYGVHLQDPIIIVANVVGLIQIIVAIGSVFAVKRLK